MAYTKTDWVDNVTLVDEARMDKIEQGIFDADALASAAQPISQKGVANGYPGLDSAADLALSDTQKIKWGSDVSLYRPAAGRLMTDGTLYVKGSDVHVGHIYGVGDGAGITFLGDTNLYRSAADLLKTDGNFSAAGYIGAYPASPGIAFATSHVGDISNRFVANSDGHLQWGPGNAGPDASLYRQSASLLLTPGSFMVGTTLYLGSAADAALNRQEADMLHTSNKFYVSSAANGTGVSGLQLHFPFEKIGFLACGPPDSGGSGYRMIRVAN